MKPESSEAPAVARAAGFRRLYKAAEDAVGPRLPRPVRDLWRRLVGRPPLPSAPPRDAASSALPPPPKAFDVVCLPIIAWSFRFQRPQQLARELGRRGHRVFWIDPDAVKEGEDAGRRGELAPNVHDVAFAATAPRDPFRGALDEADVDLLIGRLAELEREAGLAGVVAIVQLPFWAPLARRAADELGWRVVYDCMDDHSGFSTNDPSMVAEETWLLESASLVLATSRRLRDKAAPSARRLVLLPNACDYEHFASAGGPPRPPALDGIAGPVVGYVGAISEWFDFDLLRHAVRAHPEWSFVLVGSTWGAGEHADLAAAANVHFLGERPYDEVPALLARFDVACIPFRITPLIEATDPVKLYEYLAAGKPVVASRLPELEAHADHVVLVDGPEAFTAAVERALAEDGPARRSARQAFARENTWSARAARLEGAVEETFPLASVCVVTWNNLALTRACLDSVLADRTWPSVEVIVVDNASSDGTCEYLRELASRDPRVRVELNAENRGFAAANNQALAIATGAYGVLLNNDTVVPRGWLARLIAVLDRDPGIGLVGPVTDGAWNEARVDGVRVEPERVDEFAAAWAREHAREVYPIGMLAMYCVAARREVIDAVGPLDERFGIGMFEDDDWAHRVRRAGFRLACAEEVFVHHAGQASFDKLAHKDALWEENRRKFEAKWGVTWRAPGLGTRARTRAWSEELRRRVGASGGRAPVLWLSDPRSPAAGVTAALAERLAARGHLVVEVRPPAIADAERRLADENARVVSTVPLESFDEITGAIVLATPARAFDVAYFRDARLVLVDDAGGPAEARRELSERAAVVVGEEALALADGAVRVSPGDLDAAVERIGADGRA